MLMNEDGLSYGLAITCFNHNNNGSSHNEFIGRYEL